MAEESNNDKYIICSKCKCKYINDEEHISKYFGYNRLGEQFKTCVKCRDKNKQRFEQLKKEADESNGALKHCNRCYKNKSPNAFVCLNGKSYNACYDCLKKNINSSSKLNK